MADHHVLRHHHSTPDSPSSPTAADDEKALERGITPNNRNLGTTTDPEKMDEAVMGHSTAIRTMTSDDSTATSYSDTASRRRHPHSHSIKAGRPDTATLIREAVSSTPAHQRVLVAACGPDGLMRVVRDTTASLIRGDGPGVELHCEQFGW